MNRMVEQWRGCVPKAMAAEQSAEAREFAFRDARSDILELSGMIGVLCGLMKEAEVPLIVAKMDAMTSGDAEDEQDMRDLMKRMRYARAACMAHNAASRAVNTGAK